MQSIYKSYKCGSCNREIILLADEVEQAIKHGKYLACVYCSCKHLKKLKETYDLNECFENSDKMKDKLIEYTSKIGITIVIIFIMAFLRTFLSESYIVSFLSWMLASYIYDGFKNEVR